MRPSKDAGEEASIGGLASLASHLQTGLPRHFLQPVQDHQAGRGKSPAAQE